MSFHIVWFTYHVELHVTHKTDITNQIPQSIYMEEKVKHKRHSLKMYRDVRMAPSKTTKHGVGMTQTKCRHAIHRPHKQAHSYIFLIPDIILWMIKKKMEKKKKKKKKKKKEE